jgi:hypothetical protein
MRVAGEAFAVLDASGGVDGGSAPGPPVGMGGAV